jgi:hypothetical protein
MSPPSSALSPAHAATLERLRRLAQQLDASLPLPGGVRIGWDAVLGLVPGIGDWAGALISSYIILQSLRLGASREVLLRMVGNVAVEAVVGSVPVLGDVFDAAWRSNLRNVRLLEQHLASPTAARRASLAWGVGLLLLLGGVLGLGAVLAVLLIRALLSLGHPG